MSRRRAATLGAALGYVSTALAIARNVLLVPAYLHYISLAEYGAWLATGAALVQIVVSDFGLSGVLMQKASSMHGSGDTKQLGGVVGSGLLAALALSILLTSAGIAIIALLPPLHGLTPAQASRTEHCFFLAALAGGLGILTSSCFSLVRSFQHAFTAGLAVIIAELANIGTTIALLVLHLGLYALAYGLVVRSALSTAILLVYLLNLCIRRWHLVLQPTWDDVRILFADSLVSFYSSLAMKLQTQSSTFLVGTVIGPSAAAIYGLTMRACDTVTTLLGQMNGALAPSLAHLRGAGEAGRFKVLVLRLLALIGFLAAVAMTVTVSANRSFVLLWTGKGHFAGQTVSVLAGLAVWLASLASVAYDALYASGKFRTIANTYVISAIMQVVLTASLLRFGLWVAPMVTIVTTCLWGSRFWIALARNVGISAREFRVAAADLPRILLFSALILSVALLWGQASNSWPRLTLVAAGSGLAFIAICLGTTTSAPTRDGGDPNDLCCSGPPLGGWSGQNFRDEEAEHDYACAG